MTALTYTEVELARLEEFGRRRTVEALVDFSQTHLSEWSSDRIAMAEPDAVVDV